MTAAAASAARLTAQTALETLHPATIRLGGSDYTVALVAKVGPVRTGAGGIVQARTAVIHARTAVLPDAAILGPTGRSDPQTFQHLETGVTYRLTGTSFKDSLGVVWRLEAVQEHSA